MNFKSNATTISTKIDGRHNFIKIKRNCFEIDNDKAFSENKKKKKIYFHYNACHELLFAFNHWDSRQWRTSKKQVYQTVDQDARREENIRKKNTDET